MGNFGFLTPVRCDLGFTNHQLSDPWEIGLRKAGRWSALAYATTNGIGSRIFCRGREGHVGRTAPDNRLFVEAILYRFRTGIPWRNLPARLGYWKSMHQRFGRWAKSGVFERIFQLLASDTDNEYMMIDATIVREHSAGAQKKRRPSYRSIAGRVDNENSRPRRCLGQPCQSDAHGRADRRFGLRPGPDLKMPIRKP
jgi:transposase